MANDNLTLHSEIMAQNCKQNCLSVPGKTIEEKMFGHQN